MADPMKIATLGYYGFRNLGDEAVLAGIRAALAKQIRDPEFLVLSNNPAETQKLHPGVQAVNRWKWREVAASLKGTDLFVFGGGSLLQDATSVKSVLWYTLMVLLARRRSRRVLWWGQGIGPLQSDVSRKLVRLIANQADALTVRDSASAQLLKEIGVQKPAEIVADPAFALQPPTTKAPVKSSCIFAPRAWKDDTLGRMIGENAGDFWRTFEGKTGAPTLILPMHLPDDANYVRQLPGGDKLSVADWNEGRLSVVQTLGLVAQSRFVVAMRLHALIFAARCGVPFAALSYDPKVDALASASGQEDVLVPVELLTEEILFSALERLAATSAQRRQQLQSFALKQSNLAIRPAEIAADLYSA